MNFDDVFKDAQIKGYNPPYYIPVNNYYLQLCLMQKWLRDDKKINVQPVYVFHREDDGLPPYNVGKIPNSYTSFIATAENLYFDTYEEALLTGIGEVLKLKLK